MTRESMDYPFHLGVTEAGDGLDARVKSAVGIGALLLDGIGDTIRVSLTEDPRAEVPVGFDLVKLAAMMSSTNKVTAREVPWINPFEFNRRRTQLVDFGGLGYGKSAVPRVESELGLSDRSSDYQVPDSHTGDGIEMLCATLERPADSDRLAALSEHARRLKSGLSLTLSGVFWRAGICQRTLACADRVELCHITQDDHGMLELSLIHI